MVPFLYLLKGAGAFKGRQLHRKQKIIYPFGLQLLIMVEHFWIITIPKTSNRKTFEPDGPLDF